MKNIFVICLLLAASHLLAAPSVLRDSRNFNREWKSQIGDVAGADAVAFDEGKWSDANLPHSFSTPYFAANDKFYIGYGWYRKYFDVPAEWTGKRVNLEFDGVFQVAEVFVNGQRVGEHKGGYTGFTFDITDAVQPGDNVVAVRVNNLWNARLAPRAGEHVFSGGIYRDVRLVVTAPLPVAWYGTSVTTQQVSKESATVNVKTKVVNNSAAAKSATVNTLVLDAAGKTVAQMESTKTIAVGATNNIYRFDPQTWQPLGDANNTCWARGATWAIYGFALSYAYTRQERYLEAAVRLTKKFIANLDGEIIPWNDFYEAPYPGRVRDATAGAIAVCGFQELAKHRAADAEILRAKNVLLDLLCSDDYLDFNDTCCGVQKGGQGGKNEYTSWRDCYLLEALSRELEQGEPA
jgi:hypothetical protein